MCPSPTIHTPLMMSSQSIRSLSNGGRRGREILSFLLPRQVSHHHHQLNQLTHHPLPPSTIHYIVFPFLYSSLPSSVISYHACTSFLNLTWIPDDIISHLCLKHLPHRQGGGCPQTRAEITPSSPPTTYLIWSDGCPCLPLLALYMPACLQHGSVSFSWMELAAGSEACSHMPEIQSVGGGVVGGGTFTAHTHTTHPLL